MVFGWGKKKEVKTHDIPKQMEISIKDVSKIVDDILDLRKTQTLTQIKSLRDMTQPLIEELAKIGHTLEKDSLAVDDIDKHLRIIVVRGKNQVIEVIKKDVTDLPKISTFDDAYNLDSVLNQVLKKIGDVLGRQTRVIHIFAKKYAEKLKEILAQMNSNHSEIKQLIKNYDNSEDTSQEISDLIKTITHSEDEIKHNEQRILELKTAVGSLENKINSLNDSIKKIKNSKGYEQYLKLKQSLGKLDSEKFQIKNRIDSQFTKISRPLGRYEYISSDKEQRNLLLKLVEDPTQTLVSKNKDLIIIILENVRKGILSGSISVKDVDKSMTQITETVEMLDSFIKQVDVFREKIQNIESQMNAFDRDDLLKFEKDLQKKSLEKEEHVQKLVTFENQIEQIHAQISKYISLLETKLQQFTNTQYTLKNRLKTN